MEVAGCGVAALGEGVPAGVDAAEAVKIFFWEDLCLAEFILSISAIAGRWRKCPICVIDFFLR
jgi:hypothetical protein